MSQQETAGTPTRVAPVAEEVLRALRERAPCSVALPSESVCHLADCGRSAVEGILQCYAGELALTP